MERTIVFRFFGPLTRTTVLIGTDYVTQAVLCLQKQYVNLTFLCLFVRSHDVSVSFAESEKVRERHATFLGDFGDGLIFTP